MGRQAVTEQAKLEVLKKCSVDICPMRATTCRYLLDFNPRYDKVRTLWERERVAALRSPERDRLARVADVDAKHIPTVEPILMADISAGIVRCKADASAPLGRSLSLDQVAETFGITRPRVQQIEARAKEKILAEKNSLLDWEGVRSEGIIEE